MTSDALEEIFREQWARLLALLVGQFRRLDLAEEGLSEAFLAATSHWPVDGMPRNPAAWLLTTARRTILDRLRREATAVRKEPLLVVEAEMQQQSAAVLAHLGDDVRDERLRLIFLCAHPGLAREAAAALTQRLVLGVPLPDLAAVFGVNEAAMAARLTRAKRQLARVGGRFAVPREPSSTRGWARSAGWSTSRSPWGTRPPPDGRPPGSRWPARRSGWPG